MDDRLTLSEALNVVGKMIAGYPNAAKVERSYLGALADLLMRFPRSVALAACDQMNGVPRETRFMPTPSDVIAWCERKTQPMREQAAREQRVAEQLRAREEWKANAKPEPPRQGKIVTYAEFIESGGTRPVGASERGGYLGPQE